MEHSHLVAYFFGGVFLGNSVPHLTRGVTGQPFQSPFAKPPGRGLSSSTVNVFWGFFNLLVAYFLVLKMGSFDVMNPAHIISLALGALLISLFAARHFGKFHGGNI